MRHLIDSAKQSMDSGNWYAALATVLTLPDICAGLETDDETKGRHYIDWCRRFVVPIYAERHGVEFPATEIWALRCAFLHRGTGSLVGQNARKHFASYVFVLPKKGWSFGTRRMHDHRLVVEVATFCSAIVEATQDWVDKVMTQDEAVRRRVASSVLVMTDAELNGIPL